MSNMSYCRFQNTLSDLRDCQEFLTQYLDVSYAEHDMSEQEFKALRRLIKLCKTIAEENE